MLKQISNYTLDLILPKHCLVCGRYDDFFCVSCQRRVKLEQKQLCIGCGRASQNGMTHANCKTPLALDGLLAAGYFDQLLPIIHAYKYSLIRDLAEPLAGVMERFIIANRLEDFFSNFQAVPVPLHPARRRFRGFNQSELLARFLSDKLGLKISPDLIARTENTATQVSLDKSQRADNIKGAFRSLNKSATQNARILLIDDIATTGATLSECGKVLKRNGAREVWALVLARA